jgi:hypothetical protein
MAVYLIASLARRPSSCWIMNGRATLHSDRSSHSEVIVGRKRTADPSRKASAQAVTESHEQGMPLKEIGAVFETRDPEIVHRYMEFHAERLTERVAEQRRMLTLIELLLVNKIGGAK